MRTFLSVAILSVSAIAGAADRPGPGAPSAEPKNALSLNAFSVLGGVYAVEYERSLRDNHELAAFVEGAYSNIRPQDAATAGIVGPRLAIGVRWYPVRRHGGSTRGLFLASNLYGSWFDTLGDTGSFQPGAGVGAMAGWTFWIFRHLVLSLGIGADANLVGYTFNRPAGPSVSPVFRGNLGAAF